MSQSICRAIALVGFLAAAPTSAQPAGKAAPSRLPASLDNAIAAPAPPVFQPVVPDRDDAPNPLAVQVSGPTASGADQPLECQVVVTNRGSMPIVKAGMKIWTTPGIKLAEAGKQTRPPFSLEPGATIAVPIRAVASQSGTQGIKVEISADGTWKRVAEHLIEVRRSQLRVELEGPKEMKPGVAGDYAMTVTNAGDLMTRETFVFLEIPEQWEFVSSHPAAVWVNEQRYAYWSLGDFAAGQKFRYRFRIRANRQGAGEIRASAKDAGSAWGESYWFTKSDPAAPDLPPPTVERPTTLPARTQPAGSTELQRQRRVLDTPPSNISSSKRAVRR